MFKNLENASNSFSLLTRRQNNMNKYQEFILTQTLCSISTNTAMVGAEQILNLISSDGELQVKQNENYNIKKHNIIFDGSTIACADLNGQKYSSVDENGGKTVIVPVDFDTPAKELMLYFVDDLADPITLKLKFIEADKATYDFKVAQELQQQRITASNITVSTGADLVNIYFQPCCDEYCKTEITLYKNNMMLAKYRVDEECFFKSITGLAYGNYAFVLKQFDLNNQALFETDKMEFSIAAPQQPIMRRINRI